MSLQPLVSQIDGNGYPASHGKLNNIPYWRFQFGPWAIVADPVAGDIGYMVCADRDSSLAIKSPGMIVPP